MNINKIFLSLRKNTVICLSCILSLSCVDKTFEGWIIATEVDKDFFNAGIEEQSLLHFIPQSHLVIINPNNPGKPVKILTKDFYSARSPEVSYDGKRILFAAQHSMGDTWQIWEMDLKKQKSRQITTCKKNCVDPAYLPGNKFVFSKQPQNNVNELEHALFSGNLDGTGIHQITYHPHADFASTVLKDGRILTISRQLIPSPGSPFLIVMRPDGTKAELFYQGKAGSTLMSRAWETPDGRVFYVESDSNDNTKGSVFVLHQDNPLQTSVNLTSAINGSFHSVFPIVERECIVSYRPTEKEKFALFKFDPDRKSLGELIYSNPDYNVIEAIEVIKRTPPRDLPTEVDEKNDVGMLFCQDINVTGINFENKEMKPKKASRIQILGINESYGTVQVEEDGSFYLKVIANTPVRFQTLDKEGKVVQGPSAWIWVRPSERRGCIGCHENRYLVPENKVSMAVKKPPIMVPVHEEEKSTKIETE